MSSPEPILQTHIVPPPPPAGTAGPAALERRFTAGGVVSKTMQVWWRRIGAFTLMSLVTYAPLSVAFVLLFVYASKLGQPQAPAPDEGLVAKAVVVVAAAALATIALMVVQVGAVAFASFRHLQGQRARLGEMIGVGLRRGLPVVATGFLLWLAVVLGLFLLVVPGVLILVATCVAIPAAVVERPGIVAAIRRSFALTRGNRWGLFGAGLAIVLIQSVLAGVVQAAATIAATAALAPQQAPIAAMVTSQLGSALFSGLPVIAISVAYHDLRVAKEGVDTAALAQVFE